MLFVKWGLIGRLGLTLAVLAVAVFVVRRRWTGRPALQALPRSLSWPVAIFAALFVALNLLAAGCQTSTRPVYSPDGKLAARIRAADEGWLGEWSEVELFAAHGLVSSVIYKGPWEAVDASSLHWTSSSYLEIYFQGYALYCGHAFGIGVHCIPRPETE